MAGPISDNQEHILREAVRQFIDTKLQGRKPDIDEFVKQYPELEHRIRQKIRNLQKIDTLFDSLVQADESDFEDEVAVIRDELIGRKLGGFEIVEVIGRGGMGVVYLARDTKLDRSVAIKSIPPKLADCPDAFPSRSQTIGIIESPEHSCNTRYRRTGRRYRLFGS
jgi:serine/threonine protein kinase